MRYLTSFLLPVLIGGAAGCAARGPFNSPLVVADTAGLPDGYTLPTPPRFRSLTIPPIVHWALHDTIAMRYVVDTSGLTDPRTFQVVNGHDTRYIQALKESIAGYRYRPAIGPDGNAVRAWITAVMTPNQTATDGGVNFFVTYH